jgi:hypothetical protein
MDNLDFLDGSEEPNGQAQPPEAQIEAEPVAAEPSEVIEEETTEQKATRERDERGRFKAKEADEPVMVPLKALHETRDQVQQLRAELDRLRQPSPSQAPQAPDIFEDPEGFVQYQNLQLQAATLNTTLNISEEMARNTVGQEVVNEAQAWGAQAFAANPSFYQHFLQQRNPYGFLVEQYKRASTYAKLGNDPSEIEAFVAWKQANKAPQAQATSTTQTPPPSIASATSAGGAQHIATGPGVAFDNVIR